jgi:hypothetical protein
MSGSDFQSVVALATPAGRDGHVKYLEKWGS